MNANQAIARLRKAIGPKIAWEERRDAPDAAERQRQNNVATELRIDENRLKKELDALREKLLGVPDYIYLRDRLNDVRQRQQLASSTSHRYAIRVGRMGELFFTCLVEGDNWADVVARAKEKGILK